MVWLQKKRTKSQIVRMPKLRLSTFSVVLIFSIQTSGCESEKQEVSLGEELAPAILGGEGGVQSSGQTQVFTGSGTGCLEYETVRTPIPLPIFDIVPVVQIVDATEGIPGWTDDSKLPLSIAFAPVIGFNDTTLNTQVPFHYAFDYPKNNYQFSDAHLVIDTQRTNNSGTEAIFVDGVMTGVPVSGWEIPSNIPYDHSSTGDGANTYFLDYATNHYKIAARNTFDLKLEDLLAPSPLTPQGVLQDGQLNVVISDDTPVFEARLVMTGLTISSSELTCADSATFTFQNVYVHEDSNSTGQSAFLGTIGAPYEVYADPSSFDSSEFHFDATLPQVASENIALTAAVLNATGFRVGGEEAAIVVNGVGISETGFDRNSADADGVDEWLDDSTAKFDTWIATVPLAPGGGAVTLDLVDLFGADKVRDLVSQGKLNIALAGGLVFDSGGSADTRTTVTSVPGPELDIAGTYFAEVCNVPDDPNSPLGEEGFVLPEQEYSETQVCKTEGSGADQVINDGAGPLFGSIQALEITSTSAKIVWATDEGSSSQVRYGVGNTNSLTTKSSTLTTFHQVTMTGLTPFKFYTFQVISIDKFGNESISVETVFRTLR